MVSIKCFAENYLESWWSRLKNPSFAMGYFLMNLHGLYTSKENELKQINKVLNNDEWAGKREFDQYQHQKSIGKWQ